MALGDVRALVWFPEVIYQLFRFLHSVLVKSGADKNLFRSHSHMFLDAPFRQEQSKSLVCLDFFLEEQDCTSSRLTHRSPLGCPAACLEKDEAGPRLRSFEGRRRLLRQRETADFPIFRFGHALTS
jgi:hypothetical protein